MGADEEMDKEVLEEMDEEMDKENKEATNWGDIFCGTAINQGLFCDTAGGG